MFVDIEFQQTLRTCYADPRIWKGINVVMHETQMNRWASRKALIRRIQGELLLRSQPKPWIYLWEQIDTCSACCMEITPRQPVFRCFRCTKLIHFVCLMENSVSQKIPICQACASGLPQESQEEEIDAVVPLEDGAELQAEPLNELPPEDYPAELRDPYLNPLEEIVMDTGSIPCSIHGQTPTLSFDFSGPHPVAVTGARFMLLFVWRLDTVRLLWALQSQEKQKSAYDLA